MDRRQFTRCCVGAAAAGAGCARNPAPPAPPAPATAAAPQLPPAPELPADVANIAPRMSFRLPGAGASYAQFLSADGSRGAFNYSTKNYASGCWVYDLTRTPPKLVREFPANAQALSASGARLRVGHKVHDLADSKQFEPKYIPGRPEYFLSEDRTLGCFPSGDWSRSDIKAALSATSSRSGGEVEQAFRGGAEFRLGQPRA